MRARLRQVPSLAHCSPFVLACRCVKALLSCQLYDGRDCLMSPLLSGSGGTPSNNVYVRNLPPTWSEQVTLRLALQMSRLHSIDLGGRIVDPETSSLAWFWSSLWRNSGTHHKTLFMPLESGLAVLKLSILCRSSYSCLRLLGPSRSVECSTQVHKGGQFVSMLASSSTRTYCNRVCSPALCL